MNISATSAGIVASRALRDGARGVVRSVFERSFYVTLGGAWICIGPPGLGDGPLNLLCVPAQHPLIPAQAGIQTLSLSPLDPRLRGDERKETPFEAIWQLLHEGDAVSVNGDVLRIGDALTISLGDAAIWRPPPRRVLHAENLAHGLAAFDAALPAELPREGLALLLRPASETSLPPVARAALGPAMLLSSLVRARERSQQKPRPSFRPSEARAGIHNHGQRLWIPGSALTHRPGMTTESFVEASHAGIQQPHTELSSDDALGLRLHGDERSDEAVPSLQSLLGLGPGLTPSGDDFLGGAMVALTCLDMTSQRDALWGTLAPLAVTHTNDISRAHLAAAAQGFGSAALHALLDVVRVGDADAIPPRIATLAAVGHTSGWDAMAGAITVLRAVCGNEEPITIR